MSESTHATAPSAKPFFNSWRIGMCALFVASIALYWPSLYGEPVWDDHNILSGEGIGGGTLVGALTKPFLTYYRPGTALSFWIDRQLSGQNVVGYHTTNILLHSLGACLVAWLALILFRSRWAALAGGALFAVQPAQVGVAGWIGGRTDALSAVLAVLFVGCLAIACEQNSQRSSRQRKLLIASSAFCFLLALFVKEQNLALLPLATLVVWWRSGVPLRNALRSTVPYFALAAVFFVTWKVMEPRIHRLEYVPPVEILRNGLGSLVNYLLVLLGIPTGPQFTMTLENYKGPLALVAGAAIAAAGIYGLVRASKRRDGVCLAAWGFALAYLPVSNLIPIPSLLVAPYRVGVAGVFAAVLLAFVVSTALATRRPLLLLVPAALIAIGAFQTFALTPLWATDLKFSESIVRFDPNSVRATRALMSEQLQKDQNQEALEQGERIMTWMYKGEAWRDPVQLIAGAKPGQVAYESVRQNEGEQGEVEARISGILFVLAAAQDALGRHDDSLTTLRAGEVVNPADSDVLTVIGDMLKKKDKPGALDHYSRAIAAAPLKWYIYEKRGELLLSMNRLEEAKADLEKSTSMGPLDSGGWKALATVYEREGRIGDAIQALERSQKGYLFDADAVKKRIEDLRKRLNSP